MAKLHWFCAGLILAATTARAAEAPADAVERGAYLARAGDCIACHTAPGGAEFAGGLPLDTPVGRIYSTNITPDRATGIGSYSLEDFTRAVRQGVAKDGHRLYPAMPFPSYTKVSDADIQALYAYFQHGVTPVKQANRPSAIPAPLNLRFPLAIWDVMFLHEGAFRPDPAHDARWNRGAYLVEGLGHCGACHTPRALSLQEKALSDGDGSIFLSGNKFDGWFAKSLRGGDQDGLAGWSEGELVTFLKTGTTDRTAAFANMAEVVQHSTQYLSDDDLGAIAHYLKSLPAHQGGSSAAAGTRQAAATAEDHPGRGSANYNQFCVTCHRPDGGGAPHIFPALAGNDVVETADPTSLIHIVLSGGRIAHTSAHPMPFAMPGFARMDNRDVAEVVTFIRTTWGNNAAPVSADQVAKVRANLTQAEVKP